ncbi:MAG: DUF58 domain-containing protein [Planctomycetaceae bacterium]|nr:DUF58 domain-containing protein [Planctomycetaceae bacterium]
MPSNRTNLIFDESFLARLGRLRMLVKTLARGGSGGQQRSRQLGDGLEFADHRAYARGDDMRFIDWPYYARMEKLLLRLFHQHHETDVAILLDTSGSMAPSGREETFFYSLRVAACLAYVAMTSLNRVTIWPFSATLGTEMKTARNSDQILPLLEYLAGLECGGHTHLLRCVQEYCRRVSHPAGVYIISDLLDSPAELSDALACLQQRPGESTIVHVQSPEVSQPSWRGPLLLRDAESARPMTVDVSDELAAAYRQRWQAFQGGCQRVAAARGATYIAAPVDEPFEQLILLTLRKSGVLNSK